MDDPVFTNVQAAQPVPEDYAVEVGLLTDDNRIAQMKLRHSMIGPLIVALSVAHRELQPLLPPNERGMRRVLNGVAASADLLDDGSISLTFELENGVEAPFVLRGAALRGLASQLYALSANVSAAN